MSSRFPASYYSRGRNKHVAERVPPIPAIYCGASKVRCCAGDICGSPLRKRHDLRWPMVSRFRNGNSLEAHTTRSPFSRPVGTSRTQCVRLARRRGRATGRALFVFLQPRIELRERLQMTSMISGPTSRIVWPWCASDSRGRASASSGVTMNSEKASRCEPQGFARPAVDLSDFGIRDRAV
jgi:hypothetical protein